MRLSIIVALADNGVIGRGNALPWRLSADLKRFKSLTMGHHLLMGRKTFESIGRSLPGRTTIVITRSPLNAEGAIAATSTEQAVTLASDDSEAFIAGGAEIYAQTIHRASRMYLTRVHAEVEGDAYFPDFDDVNEWHLVDSEHFEADEKNEYPYSFLTYDRAAPAARAAVEFEEQG
jgi:dihydrofolate reductase